VIILTDIRKTFNIGELNEFTAIDGVVLTIEAGKLTVLKGPSGSGKTTLLGIIGCMLRPTSGRIELCIKAPWASDEEGSTSFESTSLPERFLAEIRRNTFGFIFQQFNLIRGITALENVMLPAYPAGEGHTVLRGKALALLDRFNILSKALTKVEYLSGGEAQRVTIARALMNNPAVIIADEPTAHLDTMLSHELMGIISELKEQGKTVVIASHDPIVYGCPAVDRVVTIRDGKVETV
jgi:putative ABC transport system ATP-binding protein